MIVRLFRHPPPRLAMLCAFGMISVLNYAFSVIAGHLLDPSAFGLLAFAQAVMLVAGLVLQSGVPWSLAKATVGLAGEDRAQRVRGALIANVLLASVMGAVLVGLYAMGPLRHGVESPGALAAVVLALPLFAVLAIARASAQGAEQFGPTAFLGILEVAAKTAIGLTLAAIGYGATGAIGGFAAGAAMASICGLGYLRRRLSVRASRSMAWPNIRTTAAMFGALAGAAFLVNLDVIGLKLFTADTSLTGYYQAGAVLANAPYFLSTSALVPILFTQLARKRTLSQATDEIREAACIAMVLIVPLEIMLIARPHDVLDLVFPASYAPAASALQLLAIGNILMIFLAILTSALQAVGRARIVAHTLLTAAAGEVVVLAVLAPRWELRGAASAFVAAAAASVIVIAAICLRELPISWPALLRWCSCLLLAYLMATLGWRVSVILTGASLVHLATAALAYLVTGALLGIIHDPLRAIVRRSVSSPSTFRPPHTEGSAVT